MRITDVRVRKTYPVGALKAVISITINGWLAVHDVRVVQGRDRLFVGFPNRLDKNGVRHDIFHPLDQTTRSYIEEMVLLAYDNYIGFRSYLDEESVASFC